MKTLKHLDKVYYIKKIYKYDLNGRQFKNKESRSTFVRVQTNSGSKLYRTSKYDAMFFKDIETAEKYRKDGETICELKLDETVFLKSDSKNKDILKVAKNIEISPRLKKKDGECVVCEVKEKEIYKRFGYDYVDIFVDEIRQGVRGLTSGYYQRPDNGFTSRVTFKNTKEALKEISKSSYDKFKKLYIRKINNI